MTFNLDDQPRTAFEIGVRDAIWTLAPPEDDQADDQEPDLPAVSTDDDLDRVLRDYFGFTLPNTKCCQDHSTPWHAFHDAFFARSAVAVWLASRGLGGKSMTLAALGLTEGLFLRADVNILGGSGIQSKRVLEAMGKLWGHGAAPRKYLTGGEPSSEVQKLKWGNRIQALMASQKSVRGPHPQRLRLDEVDEMKLTILDAALGQPMSKGWVLSHTVLASTHQYPSGTMTEALKRAGANGWPVFEWCYRETLEPHGWLSLGEVERKRATVTKAMWDTEYDLQEPSSEGRAIDTAKVELAFVESALLRGDQQVAVLEDPLADGAYGTGGDWAKKKNWTVIVTIRKDCRPMRVVAVRRTQKEPWPTMVGHYDEQVKTYGGTASHDNTGLGQVVHDLLHVSAEPFDMVGRNRADLLSEYISAIEQGELIWPRDDTNPALQAAYSEHKYATRDDVFRGTKDGSGKFHLPDTISAGALAYRAAKDAIAASAVQQPDESTTPHLQNPPQRGRLSSYIMGGPTGRPRLRR